MGHSSTTNAPHRDAEHAGAQHLVQRLARLLGGEHDLVGDGALLKLAAQQQQVERA